MAIKIPDNCFFHVHDAQEIDGVKMVYIPVYKRSVNLRSVCNGFILPRETPNGPLPYVPHLMGDIEQTRSVSGHYSIFKLTLEGETYYLAYIDGCNYDWIADPEAFAAKMKAYQIPRKNGTMKIKKVTIWGEETETYKVVYTDIGVTIYGSGGEELEGANRRELQLKFNLQHNPLNTL